MLVSQPQDSKCGEILLFLCLRDDWYWAFHLISSHRCITLLVLHTSLHNKFDLLRLCTPIRHFPLLQAIHSELTFCRINDKLVQDICYAFLTSLELVHRRGGIKTFIIPIPKNNWYWNKRQSNIHPCLVYNRISFVQFWLWHPTKYDTFRQSLCSFARTQSDILICHSVWVFSWGSWGMDSCSVPWPYQPSIWTLNL